MSPLERAIRDHVAEYLAGRLSLQDLDAWLWPATSEIDEIDDPPARELTYEIILRIAEYAKGHRPESEIEELLRAAIAETVAPATR